MVPQCSRHGDPSVGAREAVCTPRAERVPPAVTSRPRVGYALPRYQLVLVLHKK